MSSVEYVDRHEAKIKSITMEAPEGYEFGHIVKAEVEMRVGSLTYTTDKEGNMVRTATLVVEGCHIKESLDPAQAYTGDPAAASDDDDDDDDPVASPDPDPADAVTTDAGEAVDTDTGEIDREPVGAGVGGSVDPEVGF